ncbi:MAG: Crp/Fnr family transcriptional regulator [Burkholderiaceae bacterium]|jgi:CRP/FNR family transcriptional regulator, anaerobic regulatory protein|nr:Crp/Fnr family transcriptional regulator [Burkholderiaceae bacterium]
MIPIKTESAWKGTSDCRDCGIRELALFGDLQEQDFNLIHSPIDDLAFASGVTIQSRGDQVSHLLTLRVGMVKLVRNSVDGRARIVRILRPGDVIGLEALVSGQVDNDAVALAGVKVCRIPVAVVNRLNEQTPRVHQRLLSAWHKSLKEADDWLADLNFGNARQRVGNLILKMRASSDADLVTLLSREDMGAMMDLQLETVSRTISAFVREGIIEPLDKQGRIYKICDTAALQEPN